MALFTKETPPAKNNSAKPDSSTMPGTAFFGPNIVFDGTLTGSEDLLIEGRVSGNIRLDSDLRIGANSHVEATVHARNVTVEGTLVGDVSADNRVELISGSVVDGNIKAPKIVVSEGAHFSGTVDMGTEKPHEKKRDKNDRYKPEEVKR